MLFVNTPLDVTVCQVSNLKLGNKVLDTCNVGEECLIEGKYKIARCVNSYDQCVEITKVLPAQKLETQ